jgi:hypothetical protein
MNLITDMGVSSSNETAAAVGVVNLHLSMLCFEEKSTYETSIVPCS